MINRETFLKPSLKTGKVFLADFNDFVFVRELTGTERNTFEKRMLEEGQSYDYRCNLVALATTDVKGQRLFTDADIKELGKTSGAILDVLFTAIQRLSKLRKEDIDELEKKGVQQEPSTSS